MKKDLKPWFESSILSPMRYLNDNMNHFFDDVFDGQMSKGFPKVDIYEDHDSYVIEAELPKVAKENVKVEVDDGILSIRGHTEQTIDTSNQDQSDEKAKDQRQYHRIERHYGEFQRRFVLPEGVDQDQIDATHQQGILTIKLPKVAPEKEQKRQIEIK